VLVPTEILGYRADRIVTNVNRLAELEIKKTRAWDRVIT